MNLKYKLNNRITAVLQYNSETFAILSDEVSPTHIRCLQVLEGTDKMDIWEQSKVIAIATASQTRFPPVIAVIDPAGSINVKRITVSQESHNA